MSRERESSGVEERNGGPDGLTGRVVSAFRERFGDPPSALVRAPGRVNLIGEHTDYNDGFVLPMAMDRAVWVALRPSSDDRVRVRSMDYDEAVELTLDGLAPGGPAWAEYLKGIAWALQEAGHELMGWDGVLAGDVPIGAGLSSSAALTVAGARAFIAAAEASWRPVAMARLARRAENEWVGVSCGIMDPLISAVGRADHAVLIDCRTLDTRPVPLPDGTVVVVLDTATRRELVDSAYNERRRQCEAAAAQLDVPALRDVTPTEVEEGTGALDGTTARRARHVVTENTRTLAAADAMATGDARTLGRLMDESHASLRDDFDVSSPELDAMVEAARAAGCYGARMTGAGFGGCAIALVDAEATAAFVTDVTAGYASRTGLQPRVYVTRAGGGAAVVEPPS